MVQLGLTDWLVTWHAVLVSKWRAIAAAKSPADTDVMPRHVTSDCSSTTHARTITAAFSITHSSMEQTHRRTHAHTHTLTAEWWTRSDCRDVQWVTKGQTYMYVRRTASHVSLMRHAAHCSLQASVSVNALHTVRLSVCPSVPVSVAAFTIHLTVGRISVHAPRSHVIHYVNTHIRQTQRETNSQSADFWLIPLCQLIHPTNILPPLLSPGRGRQSHIAKHAFNVFYFKIDVLCFKISRDAEGTARRAASHLML